MFKEHFEDTRESVAAPLPLRRSWIHEGSGVAYTGSLPMIKLCRGTPGFYGPRSSLAGEDTACSAGGRPIPYPEAAGLPELRTLIAAYLERQHGLAVESDEIVVCNGATQAIEVALKYLSLTSRRSRLRCGYLTPTWLAIPWNQVVTLHGWPVEISSTFTGSGWEPHHVDLKLLISQRSLDALFLVNPGNPTGSLIAGTSHLFPLLFDHGISCILDITYDTMVYDPHSPPILPEDRRRLFIVGSLSKTFGAPGLRVGFLIPPRAAREDCCLNVQTATMGVCVVAQKEAFRLLEEWEQTESAGFAEIMEELRARRDVTVRMLGQSGFAFAMPQGAYYVFARLPVPWRRRAEGFAKELEAQEGVTVIPGTDFGSGYDSFVRISYANPGTRRELTDALERIARFVGKTSSWRKEVTV